MQLSLFDDNRPQILLNCMDDCLRRFDFDQAETILEQIREEYPDEPGLPALKSLLDEWRVWLFDPSTDWSNPAHLQQVRCAALQVTNKALRETVLAAVCNAVLTLPHSHLIYLPPDFHIGPLLMEQHRYHEAANLLQAALGDPAIPSGKLMTWLANVLTLLKKGDDALQWYLAACLPVWGVLQRLFDLPLAHHLQMILLEASTLHDSSADNSLPVPRRWFYLLLLAEKQRKLNVDCSATRRTMKQLNPFLFREYMNLMVNQR